MTWSVLVLKLRWLFASLAHLGAQWYCTSICRSATTHHYAGVPKVKSKVFEIESTTNPQETARIVMSQAFGPKFQSGNSDTSRYSSGAAQELPMLNVVGCLGDPYHNPHCKELVMTKHPEQVDWTTYNAAGSLGSLHMYRPASARRTNQRSRGRCIYMHFAGVLCLQELRGLSYSKPTHSDYTDQIQVRLLSDGNSVPVLRNTVRVLPLLEEVSH